MSTSKISITRALRELKLLDSQIDHGTSSLILTGITQDKYSGKELRTNSVAADFEKKVQSDYDSVVGLIDRRSKIKNAIVQSNAVTKIKVGEKEMTVAEAIESKATLTHKKFFLQKLVTELTDLKNRIARNKQEMDAQINSLVATTYGRDKKVSDEDYQKIAEPYIAANEVKPIDPLKLESKVDTLRKEIETFEADIDILLSESNSRTEIEV